jgi:hypothetical protein
MKKSEIACRYSKMSLMSLISCCSLDNLVSVAMSSLDCRACN